MFSPHGRIAIAELVIYIPLLCLSIFIVIKHGFNKRLGWVMMLSFCAVRVIGASFTIAAQSNPSVSNYTGAAICGNLGVAPLILVSSGLLRRIHNTIVWNNGSGNLTRQNAISKRIFALIGSISLAGLALGIYGGVRSSNSDPTYAAGGHKYSQAAVILFLINLLLVFVQALISLPYRRSLAKEEVYILYGVFASIPFILIRVIYGLLGVFRVDGSRFNPAFGDPWIYLGMSFIMEIIVIIIYVIVGMTTPRVQTPADPAKLEDTKHRGLMTRLVERRRGGGQHHGKDGEIATSHLEPQEVGESGQHHHHQGRV